MKRFIVGITLLILFILPVRLWAVAEDIPLTLDEALALAIGGNRDLLLKAEDLKKAKAKLKEAQSGALPTLTFTGGWTDTRGYYYKDIGQTSTQVSAKQYLYKGGKIINSIIYSERGIEIAQAILDKAKLDTVFNIQKAFYTYLLAEELAQVNREIYENSLAHLASLQERYSSGEVSESDILEVKKSLSSVEKAFEAAVNQQEASAGILRNLLYLEESVNIRPVAEFSYEPKELAFDEAFLKAMRRRPEIRQYEAEVKAAKSAIEIAKGDSRPNIYASWDYYSKSHVAAASGLARNWNDYNVIGLTFSWPIFDGLVSRHKVEQAVVDLK